MSIMQQQKTEKIKRSTPLREERLNILLDSCQQEVLKQIIGPFGLNKAMFSDVNGGDVTTTRNFDKGITANEADAALYQSFDDNRNKPLDRSAYDKDLPSKRKQMFQKDDPIRSAYTGAELTRDGQTHLDHVIAAKTIETDARANLFMNKAQRVNMANSDENLVAAESTINQSMQDRDKEEWANDLRKKDQGKTNAESFNVDMNMLKATKTRAEKYVNTEILKAQIEKQGQELLSTGATAAGKNALRQAFGVLLQEFVQGSFHELKLLLKTPNSEENLPDRVLASLKRVMERVINKLKDAWHALLDGGVQGFLSNFLTFLINSLITTSAKIVTIIREGMSSLWKAIKLMFNPPEGMSKLDIARQVSKIIAGVVTMGLGMLLEETVKGFILSIPLLAPLADIVAPALTGLITGIVTALVVYSIDRLFDWFASTDTELLAAYENNAEASAQVALKLENWLGEQFKNSRLYDLASTEYMRIHNSYTQAEFSYQTASISLHSSVVSKKSIIEVFEERISKQKSIDDELDFLINSYEFINEDKK